MLPTDSQTGLTQERLKSLLSYEPTTGVFAWRVWRPNGIKVGDEAGRIAACGYRIIKIDARPYHASRLAWLYMTGSWPEALIDHIDTNKLNNAWLNLRSATHTENMRNRHVQRNNESGLKGVHRANGRSSYKKWAAHIRVGGALKTIGYFDQPEEAHAAYVKAAESHFGVFARS